MNRPPKGDDYRRGNAAFMMFQPTAADVPNMTVRIRPGTFWINGQTIVEYAGGTSPTITAPRSGAKWVVVVINKLGTALVIDGVAKANNPVVPELTKNLLPVALIYVKASTKAISNDMIYDVRPTLAVGGYPFQHNQLQKREEANAHGIPAITGLQDALDNKLEVNDATTLFANKADADGTTSAVFTLNKDETGTPVEYCGISVVRGNLPPVGLRFNEGLDLWEFTNDGTNWQEITSKVATVPLANTFTQGSVRLNVEPDEESDPVAVGVNDPLYRSIAAKVDMDVLGTLVTTTQLMSSLDRKADVDAVYTKLDAETTFVTRAEYQDNGNVYTREQINTMMNLKVNRSEVAQALSDVYTKAQVNQLIAGGTEAIDLSNYYNKPEVDVLVQRLSERAYHKDTVDSMLELKADATTVTALLGTKANVADVYTKAEVDSKLASAGAISVGSVYTKGEVDAILAGKAAVIHSHIPTDIVQDAAHRLVSDDQIAAWDGKQDALGYTPINSALMGAGNGLATLDAGGKIPLSQIPTALLGGGGGGGVTVVQTGITVVADYASMLAISEPYSGQKVFVINAAADETVGTGWAEYIYSGDGTWTKTGEQEGVDLILDWANVLNKPAVFPADPDSLTAYAKVANVYTKAEVDSKLTGKSDVNHVHDDRYMTADQVTSLLNAKLDASAVDLSSLHAANQLGTHLVDESTIGHNKVLSYDAPSGKLVFVTVNGAGSGGSAGGFTDNFTVGTKTVDETALGDGKVLTYSAAADRLVYAVPSGGVDSGKVGTLEVDEANLGDGKVLAFSAASGKVEYVNIPSVGTKDVDESNIGDGKVLAYSGVHDVLQYVDIAAAGDAYTVFEPAASANGECLICATSTDVTYAKTGADVAITPGAGVSIKWVRYRLTENDMATTTQANFDMDTTSTVDYNHVVPPRVTIFSDDEGNRALVKNIARNMNTSPHTIQFTGMAHRAYSIRVDY